MPLYVYGAWRFSMDVLGDADMIRSLLDTSNWLHSFGPLMVAVALTIWALWPRGRQVSDSGEIPRGGFFGNRITGGKAINCKIAVQVVNNDGSTFDSNTMDIEAIDCERALDIQNAGKMRDNKFKVVTKTTKPDEEA